MVGRGLHVRQIELLALVAGQAREQVDVAHHRAERRLDVVRDGQHELFAGGEQRLVVAVGPFEGPAVAVAAVDVAPRDGHEEQHERHGPRGHAAQQVRRAAAQRLAGVDAGHEVLGLLLLEVEDQAVDLGIDQVVAVAQAEPLAPGRVVDVQALARNAVLQGAQHQGDRVADRPGIGARGGREGVDEDLAARDDHVGGILRRAEQVGQAAEEAPLGVRHGHRVGVDDAGPGQRIAAQGRGARRFAKRVRRGGEHARQRIRPRRIGSGERVGAHPCVGVQQRIGRRRPPRDLAPQRVARPQRVAPGQRVGREAPLRGGVLRPLDQGADILVEQAGRAARADRAAQAHRPLLLVGEQPHDAVQTHRLQRVDAPVETAQRVDAPAHGAQLAAVERLARLVAGDHELSVALGLVEVVEHLVHGAAFALQQGVAAVGRAVAHHRPVDITHREDAGRDEDQITRGDLRFDESGLFHDLKITKKSCVSVRRAAKRLRG